MLLHPPFEVGKYINVAHLLQAHPLKEIKIIGSMLLVFANKQLRSELVGLMYSHVCITVEIFYGKKLKRIRNEPFRGFYPLVKRLSNSFV